MSMEDFTKMLSGDDHLKLLLACTMQRTLTKIHSWIVFWSALSIISAIIYVIYINIEVFRDTLKGFTKEKAPQVSLGSTPPTGP